MIRRLLENQTHLHGVVDEQIVPRHQLASSHDCRRTLATILHEQEMSLVKIKAITGHSRIKDLERYLKINKSVPIKEEVKLY